MSEDKGLIQGFKEGFREGINSNISNSSDVAISTPQNYENDMDELYNHNKKVIKSQNEGPYFVILGSNEAIAIRNIDIAHEKYLEAKYDLYKKRSEMYSNKSYYDECKEQTGKNTDSTFKEYVRNKLAKEMELREKAEFEYEQAKRIYSLLGVNND